jgi:hypothetical protein
MPKARNTERLASCLPWLAAAWPWALVLAQGVPAGHDLKLEIARVAAYAYAWSDGQRPPFWAPDLYAGYGSPIFLFYGQVCVALSRLFALAAGSFSAGWLLALASGCALSTFAMQRAAASAPIAVNASAARVATYMFVLNPYVVGDALIRNSGAEYLALCAMPLAVCGLFRTSGAGAGGPLWLAAGAGLVIATHSLSALVVVALALSWLALSRAFGVRSDGQVARVTVGLGLGLALAAYAWLPAFALKPWIRSEELTSGKFDFHGQFPSASTLFDVSTFYSAGPMPLLAAGSSALALCVPRRQGDRAHVAALLALFGALLFVQTPASMLLWEHVPWMPYFQFPWRFMGPLALVSALLASAAFALWTAELVPHKRWLCELLVLGTCALCLLPQLARMRNYTSEETQRLEAWLARESLRGMPVSSTVGDEYLPVGATRRAIPRSADSAPVVAAGDGFRIAIRANQPSRLVLEVNSDAPGDVCLARFYFPLWRVEVDGRRQPSIRCERGLLGARVERGRHRIVAQIAMPLLRRVGLWLSALACLLWCCGACWQRRRA